MYEESISTHSNPSRSNPASAVLPGILFYTIAVSIAIAVAFSFYDKGLDPMPSVLLGVGASVGGVIGFWFAHWLLWLIAMRITRGAPFRTGDRIEITNGEHRGTVGEVQKVVEGCYAVQVALEQQPSSEDSPVFYWYEIRKLPK